MATGDSGLPLTGVEAAVLGFDEFISNLKKMNTAVQRMSSQMQKQLQKQQKQTQNATRESDSLGVAMAGTAGAGAAALASSLGQATSSLSGLGTVIGGLIGGPLGAFAGGFLGGAIGQGLSRFTDQIRTATRVLIDFGIQGLIAAGQTQELAISAQVIGSSMGIAQEEVLGTIDALEEAGIRADEAARVTALLVRQQINLADATELARIAQGAAILTSSDSTETLNELALAISTGSSARLRFLGFTFTASEAEEAYAQQLGITADALTAQQSRQAIVNAILEEGARLTEVYGAAMESPTKALRSLTGRELPSLFQEIAQFFLPALGTAVTAVRDFVGALRDAISEGGALRPVLVGLGAVASILADAFAAGLRVVTQFVGDVRVQLGTGFADTATSALRWGSEIVAALAEGMIRAASTVLVQAINAISGLLSFWFAPGSPPRVAPNIDDWGISAMEEFLRGMTEADFDILNAIQGPLRSILGEGEFADISEQLIAALAGEGLTTELMDTLSAAAGDFGNAIVELALAQEELAEAGDAAADAQKRLQDAQRNYSQAQSQVVGLTREYNDMLRAGATQDELDAQLARINAAETAQEAARQEVRDAEDAVDLTEQRLEQAREEAGLQRQIIEELLELARARQQAAEAGAGGGGGGGGGGGTGGGGAGGLSDLLEGGVGGLGDFDVNITDVIAEEVNRVRDMLLERAEEAFGPLLDVFDTLRTEAAEVGEAVSGFWEMVSDAAGAAGSFLSTKVFPILEDVGNILERRMSIASDAFARAMERVATPAARVLWKFVDDHLMPLLDELRVLVQSLLARAFIGLGRVVREVRDAFESADPFIRRIINFLIDSGAEVLIANMAISFSNMAQAVDALTGALEGLNKGFNDFNIPKDITPGSPPPLYYALRDIGGMMDQLARRKIPALNASFAAVEPAGIPARAVASVGGGGVVVQMGDVSISNGMDMIEFEARLRRVIRQSFGR